MKKEEVTKLHDKNIKELKEYLDKSKKELFNLMMEKTTGKLKNQRSIFHKKKLIAIIKTIIGDKELQK